MTKPAPPETLLDLTPADARERLRAWAEERRLPRYRVDQIARRLWTNPVASWSDASDLPQALREELDASFPLPRLAPEVVQRSSDGTQKFLWRLADGQTIESVLIPSGSRRTLCISSQAGCALACAFCATGRMGFSRNLAPWEIARCSTGRPSTARSRS
jgi:23S rRNA (adenine2503-C2)-methyltransferase